MYEIQASSGNDRRRKKITKDTIIADSKCWDTAGSQIHLGTGASTMEYEEEDEEGNKRTIVIVCVSGRKDAESYDPTSKICCAVSWGNRDVKDGILKIYINGVYWNKWDAESRWGWMHGCINQVIPGWSAEIRFDFCDGDTVLLSRTTWWGTKPEPEEPPEEILPDTCRSDTVAIGASGTLYDFNYQPVELEKVKEDPDCTIQIVCPWDNPETEARVEYFALGETKTYPNPENEVEIFTLTYDSSFVSGEVTLIRVTACYQSGLPPDPSACPTPVIESVTIHPPDPIVGEKVKITINMAEGSGTLFTSSCNPGGSLGAMPEVQLHSNVHHFTYQESGTFELKCLVINTCGNRSSIDLFPITIIACVTTEDVLDDYDGDGKVTDLDRAFVWDHWEDETVLACREHCRTGDWTIEQVTECVKDYLRSIAYPAPTISSISWTPTGDHITLATGAALVEDKLGGGTTQLMLVAVDPAAVVEPAIEDGEAILQIDQGDPFIVAAGDHFRFNNKEWWALNIICGPECSMITLADEVAQAEKIPKIGDEISFAANIDWHDQEMSTIKWYYAKAPGECFSDIRDLDWEEFAVGENTNMLAHTFDAEGDEEIAFFRISATNMNFATGELDTLCGPIFNLWKPAPPRFMEGWLVAAFTAFILPALAEKTEYFADLVFDGDTDPDTPSGGFSLLWAPAAFVMWIAEAAAAVAEDMFDIIFGAPEEEDAGGYGLLWTAAEFVAWLYKSIAAMVEDILDLVFGD